MDLDLNSIRDQVRRSHGEETLRPRRFVRVHTFVDTAHTVGKDVSDLARIAQDILRALERIAEFIERKRNPQQGSAEESAE